MAGSRQDISERNGEDRIKMKKIAFDIDGVLLDFTKVFQKLIEINGYFLKLDHDKFHLRTTPKMDKGTVYKYVKRAFKMWDIFPTISGAVEMIRQAYVKTDRPVQFVTSRPKEYATETHLAVKKALRTVPFAITMVNNADHKWRHLLDTDYFVDDRRRTAWLLAKRGIHVFMPNRNYNQIKKETANITIVNHLSEITDILPDILTD